MAKPETKQPLCITCLSPVDWYDDREAGKWVAYDAGTKKPHRCKEGDE